MKRAHLAFAFVLGCVAAGGGAYVAYNFHTKQAASEAARAAVEKQKVEQARQLEARNALEQARESELRAMRSGDLAALKAAQKEATRREAEAGKRAAVAGAARAKLDGMPADCDPRRVICDFFPPKPAPGNPSPPPVGPVLFEQGLEMEKAGNANDAVRVYRRAARAGSGSAAKRLGDIHSCGVPGIAPDHPEALAWYDVARKLKAKGLPQRHSVKKC